MDCEATWNRKGVTLVEALVSVAILGVLTALTLPAVQQAREAARSANCKDHLRQLGLALQQYESSHGFFPPSATAATNFCDSACDPGELPVEDRPERCTEFQSWTVNCLPFLGEAELADAYRFERAWSTLDNRRVVSARREIYLCPSTPNAERVDRRHVLGAAATDYAAVQEVEPSAFTDLFGVPDPGPRARSGVLAEYHRNPVSAILDGTSKTLMLAESAGRPKLYVFGEELLDASFAIPDDDEFTVEGGRRVVATGVGWADPDSGIDIRGFSAEGNEYSGSRMINAVNVGEAYSHHRSGAHFLLADGAVRHLAENIDAWLYVALCTRAGGETLEFDNPEE